MDCDKDSFRTASRPEIVGTGRRRRFSDEAKLRIVEEGFSGDGRQAGDGAEARRLPLAAVWKSVSLHAEPGVKFHPRSQMTGAPTT